MPTPFPVHVLDSELDGDKLGLEASTIGLSPGQWPDSLKVNGFDYVKHHQIVLDGEFCGVAYRRAFATKTHQINVYND